MPCSASTAGAAAPPAATAEAPMSAGRIRISVNRKPLPPTFSPLTGRKRDPPSRRVRGSALADRLIEPLVIKGTFERHQLLAELLGVGCGGARIKGFAVAPGLDQSEMIGVPIPLQHVVPQIAIVLAGSIGLRLDELGGLIFSGWEYIDMSDHIQRARRNLALRRCNVERAMRPHPEPVDHRGLQLLPERRGRRSLAVRLGGLFVAPDLDDREAARPRDLLEHLETEIAVLLAARFGVLPGSGGSLRRLGRVNLKIDDGIEWAARGFLRIDGPRRRKDERNQRKDQV